MKKWIWVIGLAISVVFLLSACGKSNEGNGGIAAAASGGAVKTFTIEAKNFEFDLKEIKVNKGDTVKLTLKNAEGMHAVKIDGYDQEVKDGQTVTFTADKAGEFDYACAIFCGAGHADMTGKLIVE